MDIVLTKSFTKVKLFETKHTTENVMDWYQVYTIGLINFLLFFWMAMIITEKTDKLHHDLKKLIDNLESINSKMDEHNRKIHQIIEEIRNKK